MRKYIAANDSQRPKAEVQRVVSEFTGTINFKAMEKFRVKKGISSLSSAALLEKGRTIVEMLTGNVAYPTLQALLPAFILLLDKLEETNTAVLFNGGKLAFEAKRLAELAVRNTITDFAGYVQGISGGDKALILSAGFETVKEATPTPAPTAPKDLIVRRTDELGVLKVRWTKVPASKLYYLEMLAEGGAWERVVSTTRTSHVMTKLQTGVRYTFRVQAVTSAGISQMSEEVSNIAA